MISKADPPSQRWRTVRIFISSTFRDMHAERDHLVRVVFPELKKLCRERQVHLTDVDLRWGVSEKDAQDGKALDICLNEIDTCRPYFLGLLGHRYGWIPLPHLVAPLYVKTLDPASTPGKLFKQAYLPNQDGSFSLISDERLDLSWGDQRENHQLTLAAALESLGVPGAGQSITAAEIFHGVLHNDMPRQVVDLPAIIEGRFESRRFSEAQVDCLSRSYKWDGEKRKYLLSSELSRIDADIIRSVFREYAAYQRDRSFFFFRSERLSKELANDNHADFFDVDPGTRARLDTLKEEVKTKGLSWFEYDDLEAFGAKVRERLWQRVQYESGQKTALEKDWLDIESDFHHIFANDRTRRFVGRRAYLDKMQEFCERKGRSGSLLVIKGEPGCGKSALMARFSEEIQHRHPDWLLVPHFVGASPNSTNLRRTLRRFYGEINRFLALAEEIPEDIRDLHNRFPEKLKQAAQKGRVVFIFDAVNQMERSDNPQDMTWLPVNLPDNVSFVISSLDGESLDALLARKPEVVEPSGLDAQEIEALVGEFLADVRKSFPNLHTRDAFLAKAKHGSPLYITVALEELRIFGAFKQLSQRIDGLPPDIPALFQQVLDRVEKDFFALPGLVGEALSLIAGSRQGMTPEEMKTLLAQHAPVLIDGSRPDRLPDMIWSRLRLYLDAYLFERSGAIDFFHGQFKQAVGQRWLKEKEVRLQNHQIIADYFKKRWADPYVRALDELPHQEIKSEDWDGLTATLCNLEFLQKKCAAGLIYEVTADYWEALAVLPENRTIVQRDKALQARLEKYTLDLVAYAKGEIKELQVIPSVELSSDEELEAERQRIIENPTRLDRVKAFAQFMNSEGHHFLSFGAEPSFFYSHACSYSDSSPVSRSAEEIINSKRLRVLLRHPAWRPSFNPHPACLRTLEEGTTDCVVTVDGRRAVSGNSIGTIKVWDLETGRCLRELEGHAGPVDHLALTADGRWMVSSGNDHTMRTWDLLMGNSPQNLGLHGGIIEALAVSADGRFAVSVVHNHWYDEEYPFGEQEYRLLQIWDMETGHCLNEMGGLMDGYVGTVYDLALTGDGRRAVAVNLDGKGGVWDLEMGRCMYTLEDTLAFAITADGRLVVSGGNNSSLRVLDLETGRILCTHRLQGYYHSIGVLALTADGRRAITDGIGHKIRVWDLETGRCLRELEGHLDKDVHHLALTADGRWMVSNASCHTMRLWDMVTGRSLPNIEGYHDYSVKALALTADGRRAITGRDEIRVWDLETGHSLLKMEGDNRSVEALVLTADERVVVSRNRHTLEIWDLVTGRCLRSLEEDNVSGRIRVLGAAVALTADGRGAVTGSCDKTLQFWDIETGRCLRTLTRRTRWMVSSRLFADGEYVTFDDDGIIIVKKRNSDNLHSYNTREERPVALQAVALSEDGKRAFTISNRHTLRVWDLEMGRRLRTVERRISKILPSALGTDGRLVVTESGRHELKVWDLETIDYLCTLEGHTNYVNVVALDSDGGRAVSGSVDKTIRIWDLVTGKCLAAISLDAEAVGLAVRGSKILAGLSSGRVEVFEFVEHARNEMDIGAPPLRTTAVRRWLFGHNGNPGKWDDALSAICPACRIKMVVPHAVIDAIMSLCRQNKNQKEDSKKDTRFSTRCSACHRQLRYNPFIIDNRYKFETEK